MYSNKIEIINDLLTSDLQLNYNMKECDNQSMMFQDVSFFLCDEKARAQGLQDLVQHHSVVVNGGQFKKLKNSSVDENVVKLALQLCRQRGEYREENGLAKSGVIIRHLVLPGHRDDSKAALLIRSDILNPMKTFVYVRSGRCGGGR